MLVLSPRFTILAGLCHTALVDFMVPSTRAAAVAARPQDLPAWRGSYTSKSRHIYRGRFRAGHRSRLDNEWQRRGVPDGFRAPAKRESIDDGDAMCDDAALPESVLGNLQIMSGDTILASFKVQGSSVDLNPEDVDSTLFSLVQEPSLSPHQGTILVTLRYKCSCLTFVDENSGFMLEKCNPQGGGQTYVYDPDTNIIHHSDFAVDGFTPDDPGLVKATRDLHARDVVPPNGTQTMSLEPAPSSGAAIQDALESVTVITSTTTITSTATVTNTVISAIAAAFTSPGTTQASSAAAMSSPNMLGAAGQAIPTAVRSSSVASETSTGSAATAGVSPLVEPGNSVSESLSSPSVTMTPVATGVMPAAMNTTLSLTTISVASPPAAQNTLLASTNGSGSPSSLTSSAGIVEMTSSVFPVPPSSLISPIASPAEITSVSPSPTMSQTPTLLTNPLTIIIEQSVPAALAVGSSSAPASPRPSINATAIAASIASSMPMQTTASFPPYNLMFAAQQDFQ